MFTFEETPLVSELLKSVKSNLPKIDDLFFSYFFFGTDMQEEAIESFLYKNFPCSLSS